MNILKAGLF